MKDSKADGGKRTGISWRASGFYILGMVAFNLYTSDLAPDGWDGLWRTILVNGPLYIWLMTLSVRLFGRFDADT